MKRNLRREAQVYVQQRPHAYRDVPPDQAAMWREEARAYEGLGNASKALSCWYNYWAAKRNQREA